MGSTTHEPALHRLSADKDVRSEIRTLRELGFAYAGATASGHPQFVHERYGEITMPHTPSSYRWRKLHRHTLAKLMGLNQWQLERLIAGQPLTRRTRKAGPGRKSNEDVVREYAASLGIRLQRHQPRRLISRFEGVKGAKRALDQMAEAATNRAA